MRKRTQARELALQLMYQLDLRGDEILEDVNESLAPGAGDPEMLEFARELVHGCREKRAEIDRQIEEVAKNWQLKRMAAIDRNILRLGAFEMIYCPDMPPKVAINEALELAKRYSTAQSSRFVNGILDRLQGGDPTTPPGDETPPLPDPDTGPS